MNHNLLDVGQLLKRGLLKYTKESRIRFAEAIRPTGMTLSELVLAVRGYRPSNLLEDELLFYAEFQEEFAIYDSAERDIQVGLLHATSREIIEVCGRVVTRFWLNPLQFLLWAEKNGYVAKHSDPK